ncbi:hypothetical protein ACPF8X_29970 [Streptomyces sp. G35A]
MELARRRHWARAGDALIDDPQQITADSLIDVQVEFLGELTREGLAEVLPVFDVAAGRGVVNGAGPVAADEGDIVAAEDEGPGANLDPGERGRRRVASAVHGRQYRGPVRGNPPSDANSARFDVQGQTAATCDFDQNPGGDAKNSYAGRVVRAVTHLKKPPVRCRR